MNLHYRERSLSRAFNSPTEAAVFAVSLGVRQHGGPGEAWARLTMRITCYITNVLRINSQWSKTKNETTKCTLMMLFECDHGYTNSLKQAGDFQGYKPTSEP